MEAPISNIKPDNTQFASRLFEEFGNSLRKTHDHRTVQINGNPNMTDNEKQSAHDRNDWHLIAKYAVAFIVLSFTIYNLPKLQSILSTII